MHFHEIQPQRTPGIYSGIPEEKYHGGPEISISGLKMFAEPGGPARYRYGKRDETRALRLGSLLHCALLEPNDLDKRYCVVNLERFDPRSSAYKDAEAAALGRELVKRADYDNAKRFADQVLKTPLIAELFSKNLEVENSVYWTDPVTGLACRGRVDAMRRDHRILIDIKSTESANPSDFARTCANYRYHWQDAYYRDGILESGAFKPEAFLFIAIEKTEPYVHGIYELEERALDLARSEIRLHLDHFAQCKERDQWPGLPGDLVTLPLPSYLFN
jgi:exodeoxyribonuclease VIII